MSSVLDGASGPELSFDGDLSTSSNSLCSIAGDVWLKQNFYTYNCIKEIIVYQAKEDENALKMDGFQLSVLNSMTNEMFLCGTTAIDSSDYSPNTQTYYVACDPNISCGDTLTLSISPSNGEEKCIHVREIVTLAMEVDECGKLWVGGCADTDSSFLTTLNGAAGTVTKSQCRDHCKDNGDCAVFVINEAVGDTCKLFTEDAMTSCTRGVDLQFTTYSVNVCSNPVTSAYIAGNSDLELPKKMFDGDYETHGSGKSMMLELQFYASISHIVIHSSLENSLLGYSVNVVHGEEIKLCRTIDTISDEYEINCAETGEYVQIVNDAATTLGHVAEVQIFGDEESIYGETKFLVASNGFHRSYVLECATVNGLEFPIRTRIIDPQSDEIYNEVYESAAGDWNEITKQSDIRHLLDLNSFEIMTDSMLESDERIEIHLDDENGQLVSSFSVKFGAALQFNLGACSAENVWLDFDINPPPERNKVWTIIKLPHDLLFIRCNGIDVLRYEYPAACKSLLATAIHSIEFAITDTASDNYRAAIGAFVQIQSFDGSNCVKLPAGVEAETELQMSEDCDFSEDSQFWYEPSNRLQHVSSGYCVSHYKDTGPKTSGMLALSNNCPGYFANNIGGIRHTASSKIWQRQNDGIKIAEQSQILTVVPDGEKFQFQQIPAKVQIAPENAVDGMFQCIHDYSLGLTRTVQTDITFKMLEIVSQSPVFTFVGSTFTMQCEVEDDGFDLQIDWVKLMEYKSGESYQELLVADNIRYTNSMSYNEGVASSTFTVLSEIGDDPITKYSCRVSIKEVAQAFIEVEVLSFFKNLALNRATEVDSALGVDASLAVDGFKDGNLLFGQSITSLTSDDGWWKVTLDSESYVDYISIFVRSDCCQMRVNNAQVLLDDELLGVISVEDTFVRLYTIYARLYGQEIKVVGGHTKALQLAEVEVYGAESYVLGAFYWSKGHSFAASFIMSHSLGVTASIIGDAEASVTGIFMDDQVTVSLYPELAATGNIVTEMKETSNPNEIELNFAINGISVVDQIREHWLRCSAELEFSYGVTTIFVHTAIYMIDVVVNGGRLNHIAIEGESIEISCEISSELTDSNILSEIYDHLALHKIDESAQDGFMISESRSSCSDTCTSIGASCINDLITLDNSATAGFVISRSKLTDYLSTESGFSIKDTGSQPYAPFINDREQFFSVNFEQTGSRCEEVSPNDVRRFCFCLTPDLSTEIKENGIKLAIESIGIKSESIGHYQCTLDSNQQLLLTEVAQLRVGYWNFYPADIVLRNKEQLFSCGAALLGDSPSDIPVVKWQFDSNDFPSLRSSNPTVKGRADIMNSGNNILQSQFRNSIHCTGSYRDSSGPIELRPLEFNVKLLEITATQEGETGYAAVDARLTLTCEVSTTDGELGRNLKMLHGLNTPIWGSEVVEKFEGSNTVSFTTKLKAGSSISLQLTEVNVENGVIIMFHQDSTPTLKIELSKDYIRVNDDVHINTVMYEFGAELLDVRLTFISTKSIGIEVNSVPVKYIALESGSKSWNNCNVENGNLARFWILNRLPVVETTFQKKSSSGITTISHMATVSASSDDDVGYFLCFTDKLIQDVYYQTNSEPLNILLATFINPPTEEVESIALSGKFFEMSATAMYFGESDDPKVSLIEESNSTEVNQQYQSLFPSSALKTLTIAYAIPWSFPYVRLTNYTWSLNYTDIMFPGVVKFSTKVYQSYLTLESDSILALEGTATTVICHGYGVHPGPRFGQLIINDVVQSSLIWPVQESSFDATEKMKTLNFVGEAEQDNNANYECQAEYSDGLVLKSINSATIFTISFSSQPNWFDGIVGMTTTLFVSINVPNDETTLNVVWVDETGLENEESFNRYKNEIYMSYFEGLMDLSKTYFAKVVIGSGELRSLVQSPLLRSASLVHIKILAVERETAFIPGLITATTKPSDIQWFRNGVPVTDPSWTIGEASETTFDARLYFWFDPQTMNKEDIVGDYTYRVFWQDGDRVNSTGSTELQTCAINKDLEINLFAPYDFPLTLTVEVDHEPDYTINFKWYEYWTMEYIIDDSFVESKKGTSTLITDPVTDFYENVQYYASIEISIEETEQKFLIWTRTAEVVVQKAKILYKEVQDQIAFVVEGSAIELECIVLSPDERPITWILSYDVTSGEEGPPVVISERGDSYQVSSSFIDDGPKTSHMDGKLTISSASSRTLLNGAVCQIESRGVNVTSDKQSQRQLMLYLLHVVDRQESLIYQDEMDNYVITLVTDYYPYDLLEMKAYWYYSGSFSRRKLDLDEFPELIIESQYSYTKNEDFDAKNALPYGKTFTSKLIIPVSATERYPVLRSSSFLGEVVYSIYGEELVVTSPDASKIDPQSDDCKSVMLLELAGNNGGFISRSIENSLNVQVGDMIIFSFSLNNVDEDTGPALFSLTRAMIDGSFCEIFSISIQKDEWRFTTKQLNITEEMEEVCLPGATKRINLIDPSELNFGRSGLQPDKRDLKILIEQKMYEMFFDLVTPDASPVLSINHFLGNVNKGYLFNQVVISALGSSFLNVRKVNLCEMGREVKAIPHPTIPNAYYLSLTWLGVVGGICGESSSWDATDLAVVCKETGLGSFGGLTARAVAKSEDFELDNNFWLKDGIECPLNPIGKGFDSSDMDSIYECEKSGWLTPAEGSSCRKFASFTCFEQGLTGVRLMSYNTDHGSDLEGLLEVNFNGEWRGVCGTFTENDVTAACLSMNLGYGEIVTDVESFMPRRLSSDYYWQDSFACTEEQRKLEECDITKPWGTASCETGGAIAIKCKPRLHCSECTGATRFECFHQDAMRDVLCHEDTQSCFKINSKFEKKENDMDFSVNFTAGCMPTIDKDTSFTCSDLEEEIKDIYLNEETKQSYLNCKECPSDYCNRPVLLQSVNMLKKTQNSYIEVIESIISIISLPVRLFSFDLTVFPDLIAFF